MKIYVAARTSQRDEVKKINKKLVDLGHEVFDWTWHKNTKPYLKHKKLAEEYSIEDINSVRNSDVFILLTSDPAGNGSTTEFGIALLSNVLFHRPKIYVVGEEISNMFFIHPNVIIKKTTEEVLQEISS